MSDVVISYAREDQDFAVRLASALNEYGISVWLDLDLMPGDAYRAKIPAAIIAAKKVLVLWSKQSTESSWVLDEALKARRLGKLIPLSIDGSDPPLGFGDLNTTTCKNIKTALPRIVAAIEGRRIPLPPVKVPRRHHTMLTGTGIVLALGLGVSTYLLWPTPGPSKPPSLSCCASGDLLRH
jgi:TIR domain